MAYDPQRDLGRRDVVHPRGSVLHLGRRIQQLREHHETLSLTSALDVAHRVRDTQFSRPAYQALAVDTYLSKLVPGTYAGLYNPSGRVRTQAHAVP